VQGILEHELMVEILAGPPVEGGDALCEQVLGILDGNDIEWIKRINRIGVLTVSELLALLLCKVREIEKPDRDEKKVILDWAKVIRTAVKDEKIIGLDPVSYTPMLPISLKSKKGWDWETRIRYADQFLEQTGTDWRCGQIVKKLLHIKRGKATEDALKIDFLKLIALFATDEAYGYDPSKRTRAVSLIQRDLQTIGINLSADRIRTYVSQAINGNIQGLSTSTAQKLAIGLARALHGYKLQSPEISLLKMVKDSQTRGADLTFEKIQELLEIASRKHPPSNPHKH
jgi:hypothetical protein